jgi:hypothetical protein
MQIQKFREYLILEGNTPEDYMSNLLNDIQVKLEPVFDTEKVKTLKDFKNVDLQLLNDPKVDNFAATARSLKYKFTDDGNTVYELTFTINLKDAINPKPDEDYKTSEIKKVHVGFKKYNTEGTSLNMVGQLMDRSVSPDQINPDFLIQLKLDLDEGKTETEEEEFKIETGEEKPAQGQAQKPAQGQAQGQKPAQQPAEESEEQTPPPAQGQV